MVFELKKTSLYNGALGCGISGSGPSVFAISKGASTAKKVGVSMGKIYNELDLEYDIHISYVNDIGIKILEFK